MSESSGLGSIIISPTAIASIAGQAVLESYGVVGLAPRNFRDGISDIFRGADFRRGVHVHVAEDQKVTIDLYVVVEYGTRISEVANGLIHRVQYTVEHAVGLPVTAVNVHIQGLHISNSS